MLNQIKRAADERALWRGFPGRLFAWLVLLLSPYAHGAEIFAPEPASGPPTIDAHYPDDGRPSSVIGKLIVAGTGEVTFFANRVQGRLVLKAVGADGAQIGRAESVVGLGDTPIYIHSAQGLYKILIHWKT
jgi:hypothetical protein